MSDPRATTPTVRVAWTALVAFGTSLAYAILRYVVLGTTPAAQIPLYVTNKAIAVTGLALLGLAVTGRSADARRARGLAGAAFAILHVVVTTGLMSPTYFRQLYSGGFLTAWGGTAVLAGSVSSIALLSLAYPAARWSQRTRAALSLGVLALVGGHLLALGAPGWRIVDGLPAVSLISFLYVVCVLGMRASRRLAAHLAARRARVTHGGEVVPGLTP